MGRWPARTAWFAGAAIAILLVASVAAAATVQPRQAYTARAEPICKAGTPPIEQLLHGTRKLANHGQAVLAGRRFVRASEVFAGTVRRVAAVRRPSTDAALLGRWVEKLRDVKEGLRRVGTALKQHSRLKALNRVGQLRDAGTAANQVVAGFHFRYCLIRESRFS